MTPHRYDLEDGVVVHVDARRGLMDVRVYPGLGAADDDDVFFEALADLLTVENVAADRLDAEAARRSCRRRRRKRPAAPAPKTPQGAGWQVLTGRDDGAGPGELPRKSGRRRQLPAGWRVVR